MCLRLQPTVESGSVMAAAAEARPCAQGTCVYSNSLLFHHRGAAHSRLPAFRNCLVETVLIQ